MCYCYRFRYREGKTSLDLNEARDNGVLGWQWYKLDLKALMAS